MAAVKSDAVQEVLVRDQHMYTAAFVQPEGVIACKSQKFCRTRWRAPVFDWTNTIVLRADITSSNMIHDPLRQRMDKFV